VKLSVKKPRTSSNSAHERRLLFIFHLYISRPIYTHKCNIVVNNTIIQYLHVVSFSLYNKPKAQRMQRDCAIKRSLRTEMLGYGEVLRAPTICAPLAKLFFCNYATQNFHTKKHCSKLLFHTSPISSANRRIRLFNSNCMGNDNVDTEDTYFVSLESSWSTSYYVVIIFHQPL